MYHSQATHSVHNRLMNTHITSYVDQALQPKYESLVDRGANGSLAG